jgi:uncharacterized protein (DUF2461 family)
LNSDDFYAIVASKKFKSTFGELLGERLKTSPKGFDKEHKALELLQLKQFLVSKSFTDKEVMSDNFAEEAAELFKKMRPFFDLMSSILTTNLNGESIV